MRLELKNVSAERKLAAVEIAQLASERNALNHALKRAQQIAEEVGKLEEERSRSATLAQALELSTHALEAARVRLEAEQDIRHGLETSLSWRVTKPLRKVSKMLKQH